MSHGSSYRPDVDGLRAVAVLSVVFCHARLGFPGGFVGVDVFFVISGYLIGGLIRKDLRAGTFSLVDFWIRRIRRILPALAVVTAATFVAGWYLLFPHEYYELARSVKALLKLTANMHFMEEAGYFQRAAEEKPLLHTWSLAVEEQFYLVVPLTLMLLRPLGRDRGTVFFLIMALMLSFAVSVWGTSCFPVATFYLMPARAWELLVGALLAYAPSGGTAGNSLRRELAAVAGLSGILIPVFLYDQNTIFPGLAAVPPVAGAAVLIRAGGGRAELPLINRLLGSPPMVFVGLISYSLYLWHWPLLVFARYRSVLPLSDWDHFGLILLSLCAGVFSWRFVEIPCRTNRILASRPMVVFGLLASVTVLYGTAKIIEKSIGFVERLPSEAREFAAAGTTDLTWVHEPEAADVPDRLAIHGEPGRPAKLCREKGIAACEAARPRTAPIVNFIPQGQRGRNDLAIPFNNAVMNHVRNSQTDKVLLIALWSSYLGDSEAEEAFLKTVDELNTVGVRVYFMKQVPVYSFDVPRALARYSMAGRDLTDLAVPVEFQRSLERFYHPLTLKLIERGVVILDPIPLLRSAERPDLILPFNSGGSLYRDSGHLSVHGALTIEPLFAEVFDNIGTR